jgi:hypothetical protein
MFLYHRLGSLAAAFALWGGELAAALALVAMHRLQQLTQLRAELRRCFPFLATKEQDSWCRSTMNRRRTQVRRGHRVSLLNRDSNKDD